MIAGANSATGRVEWTSDLAEIPAKYGVSNVYADLGQIFAQTTVVEPRLCAALMGMLVKGMGADHVVWGTDAVWTGSPQWQIEALRRLEIPEDIQKKYGYAPLGPADGPIKTARGLWAAPHTITTAMLLKADGTYEVYWYPSYQLRSRGTYTYSPETTRFRWLSGLNYEMGRGGTYIAEEGPCRPCIQMNGSTVAVPQ